MSTITAATCCKLAEIAVLQFRLTPKMTEQKIKEVFEQAQGWIEREKSDLGNAQEMLPLINQYEFELRRLAADAFLDCYRRDREAKERELGEIRLQLPFVFERVI